MKLKIKVWLINTLRKWLNKLNSQFNDAEHQQRLSIVRAFLHETLPSLDEQWGGKAIIEGGKYNYFELPSGSLPYYDFVLPEVPLYVIVPGVVSANWPEASERGISRNQWEIAQADMIALEQGTLELATIGLAAAPRLLIVKWNDPVNHLTLAHKLEELINE